MRTIEKGSGRQAGSAASGIDPTRRPTESLEQAMFEIVLIKGCAEYLLTRTKLQLRQ